MRDRKGTIIDPKMDILYDRLRKRKNLQHKEKGMIKTHEDLLWVYTLLEHNEKKLNTNE